MKILVVEDDKFLAKAYKAKLGKSSHDVRIALDGEAALTTVASFIPDVILLDLVMPKKDGFAVLTELKGNAKTKSIPVIVASNLGQKEDVEKAKKLGADDYVIKTNMSISDLVAKVEKYGGKKASAPDADKETGATKAQAKPAAEKTEEATSASSPSSSK